MTIDPDAPAADGEERAVDLGAVVRRVDTAIGVVRPDGTMVELTEAIEAITGFPPGHYRGGWFADEVHPDDLTPVTATLAELVDLPDGSRRHLRLRMATRGGGWRWIDQVVTRAVDVPGVHGYVASVRDVDEAQRAWDALSASARRAHGKIEDLERQEAALRALLDSTADAVAVLDEHGHITWISNSVQGVSGWTTSQVMAMDPDDLVHPEDRELLGRHFLAVTGAVDRGGAQAVPDEVTCRLRNAGGEYLWVAMTMQDLREVPDVGGIAVTLRDTDDLVRAQLALAGSERRFRALVQHGSDVVFTFRDDLTVTTVTDAVEQVLGYRPDEVVGERAFANVIGRDRARVAEVLERLRGDPGATERLRLRVRDAAGERRWNTARITNLLDHPEVGEWVCNFWDVTDMVRAEEENRRLLEIFDLTEDSVLLVDPVGNLMYINAAGRRFFGISDERVQDLLGHPWPLRTEVNHDLSLEEFTSDDFTSWSGEVTALGADGLVPVALQVLAHRGEDGTIEYFSAIARDISERKQLEASLERQATHDPLTGLPNRTLLFDRITAAVAGLRASGTGRRVGLLFIDLDHFKVINDSLGHALGDRLLRSIGERIQSAVRPGDTVARFGGDEFVVLCERLDTTEDAIVIAHRVEVTLQIPFLVDGHEIHAGVSIGIAYADPSDPDPVAVLRDADTAMYRAKSEGRGRWVIFDDALRQQAVDRQRVETALRQTRHGRDLVLHYQPVADLHTGRIVSVEALVRWHRDGVLVLPDQFIPVAEETGLIIPIGAWVLRSACQQVAAWQAADGAALGLAVNVSARQLQHPGFVASVAGIVADSGLGQGTLTLEITETVLLEDVQQLGDRLEELRALGIRIAMDDFGTGYSSLTYLHRLPIDIVKLDRSFVAGVGADGDDTAIVTAVLSLAATMGLDTVAEGIETEPQLERLRDLGCGLGQGSLLSEPVPARDLAPLLGGMAALRSVGPGRVGGQAGVAQDPEGIEPVTE